jgi:hypothetical protein
LPSIERRSAATGNLVETGYPLPDLALGNGILPAKVASRRAKARPERSKRARQPSIDKRRRPTVALAKIGPALFSPSRYVAASDVLLPGERSEAPIRPRLNLPLTGG